MVEDKKQLVMGVHAVFDALRYAPQSVKKIFLLQEGRKRDPNREQIIQLANRLQKEVVFTGKRDLENMVGSSHHQGACARIRYENEKDLRILLDNIPKDSPSLILMLDSVVDPQNVGAIFRVAECFGIDGIIWSKNRGCDLVPSLGKSSSGASLIVPFARVSNLASSLEVLVDYEYEIGATNFDEEAKDPFAETLPKRLCLILGSEGQGVRPLLLKKADEKWCIPLQGKLQSLNVVQAATTLTTLWKVSTK